MKNIYKFLFIPAMLLASGCSNTSSIEDSSITSSQESSSMIINDYSNFHFAEESMTDKTFTVFGDSISEVTDANYNPKPNFWCEQLKTKFSMTLKNFALGGSTLGYTAGQAASSISYMTNNTGACKVCTGNAKKAVKKSSIVFIYFGSNDFSYGTSLGADVEINDDNYKNTESFIGQYKFIINKIRSYNSEAVIVCMGIHNSSWGIIYTQNQDRCATRKDMSDVIKQIAADEKCKFIELYDLWETADIGRYCPDGMHPNTDGYNLMVERILNS